MEVVAQLAHVACVHPRIEHRVEHIVVRPHATERGPSSDCSDAIGRPLGIAPFQFPFSAHRLLLFRFGTLVTYTSAVRIAIREERLALGMTQKELARALGVSLRTLQQWEQG